MLILEYVLLHSSVSTIYSLLILHIVKMHIAIYCSIVALTCSLDNRLINFQTEFFCMKKDTKSN